MAPKDSQHRKHRFVNRSRSGCSTCKERRVRCDERRPMCINCTKLGRICEYPGPVLPLRDRRRLKSTLPGVHVPWRVAGDVIDPFNSLQVEMAYRSKELLYHFISACGGSKVSAAEASNISIAGQDPIELRTSLLIAALHYAWKTREYQTFESTYLFHKIECINLANKCLNDFDATKTTATVKLIATLCVVESGFGNLLAAKTHLDGLMTVLDLIEDLDDADGSTYAERNKILGNYIAVAHEFVYTTTGYLHPRLSKMTRNVGYEAFNAHKDPSVRLDGLRVIPYFTGKKSTAKEIQSRAYAHQDLDGLKILTPLARERYCSRLCCFIDDYLTTEAPQNQPIDYVESLKTAAMEASKREVKENYDLVSRPMVDHWSTVVSRPLSNSYWSRIAPGGALYVDNVVADRPINDCDVYSRLYIRLTQDIDNTEGTIKSIGGDLEIWLWKVFTGAYTIAKTQIAIQEASGCPEDDTSPFRTLRHWFGQRIRTWSRAAQVTDWQEAKEVLTRIDWPKDSPGAGLSEKLWQEAVWGNMNVVTRFDLDAILMNHN
ncbi:hypothetical protein GQ53DRAFT_740295 [Thozetella sp. PMI_491]|nr:hypothetical protein GQ53DRAFT_740295 [Thozetella sp. PMI_491]